MADNVQAVEQLLEELRVAALPVAEQEIDELRDCARHHGATEADDFSPWDVSYWAEKLRQERFNLNQEELRPWFPLPQVLDGLFHLCERLFSIQIEAADGEAPVSFTGRARQPRVSSSATQQQRKPAEDSPLDEPRDGHGRPEAVSHCPSDHWSLD